MADLAVYLVRSAAFLALFFAFYWVTLRKETYFVLNRAFLLAAATLSLALPLLRVPSPFFTTVIDASTLGLYEVPTAGVALARAPGLLDVLTAIYAVGAGLFLILFLARLARLALLIGRCGCVRHQGLRVVLCGHPGESFSFFNYVFLNRSKVPEEDMDRVLAHELAHVRQLHSLDIVFSELLTVIQWFNPFVWPYRRSLRETHEYLADRAVIAQGCSLAGYQLLIVEQHVGGKLLELASSFRTSQIKRRIVMLSKQQTKGLARWKPLLVLPLAVALVLVFAESRTVVREGPAAGVAPMSASGAPPSQEMSEEEMAKALKEKMLQLEDMKKKNAETMAKLEQKLKEAPDAAAKEKVQAAMQEQKVMALDLGVKERSLKMKKLEYALNKETDPAKKTDLEHQLQVLHVETDELMKKAEVARNAKPGLEKEKAAAEKKIEKK
ncbi:MAG TPA: M56 family metallopeptidase [Acidobacteriota bacterium]|nr:M56 family metallopeptidase [Acidobacteriota bacterium]